MKKLLVFILPIFMLASCSDKLDSVDSTGKISSEAMDRIAQEDADKVLLGTEASIYTHMATYYNSIHSMTGMMGQYLTFGMMGVDMPLILQHSQSWYDYIIDYNQEEYNRTSTVWNFYYIPIATTNEILKTATKDAETTALKNYRARALTARAYFYYMLINVYQFPYSEANKDLMGVPVSTEENLGTYQPRGTMEQTYKRITDDLDEAMAIFKATAYNDTENRADFDYSVAALIRARVAMIMQDWTLAKTLAGEILDEYTLIPKADYNNGFNQIGNVSSTIMGFKMSADNCQTWASWVSQMDPYLDGYAGMWAERPIHSYLYAKLNKTDVRRGWWLNTTDNPNPEAETDGYACLLPDNLPNIDKSGVKSRSEYVSVKFRAYKGDWNSSDLIYMRAEEAVFIKAEAEAHSDLNAAKKTLADYVQTYRDPQYTVSATSTEDVISEIILQKRIEMWMEGSLEYLDRRRLGLPVDRRDDADMEAQDIENNHIYKKNYLQTSTAMRYQLPRTAVLANTEIGEANQNEL